MDETIKIDGIILKVLPLTMAEQNKHTANFIPVLWIKIRIRIHMVRIDFGTLDPDQ